MKVLKDTIYSEVSECTDEELTKLKAMLTFYGKLEMKSHIDSSGRFYTGLIQYIISNGMEVEVNEVSEDKVTPTVSIKEISVDTEILDNRSLRDYQCTATRKALYSGRGIIQAATGSGKTEMSASAIKHFRLYGYADTVVCLAPTVFLMQQMANKFEEMGLGKVNRIGGGHKFKKGCTIHVYVVNSALRALQRKEGEPIVSADMLVLDECHHAHAQSWVTVTEACPAKIRLAYTATVHDDPEKWSYEDLQLVGLTGGILLNIRSKELRVRGYLADPLVTILKVKTGRIPVWSWHKVYKLGIVSNKVRNSMILSLAASVYEGGYKIMIFISMIAHGHDLARKLALSGCECVFVHGGSSAHIYKPSGSKETKKWGVDDIGRYINNRERVILITSSVLDEGIDIPVINVLIMGTGMKKYRRTIQRVGRGMRPKEGQNRVFIFDFMDTNHNFLKAQSDYRMWTYKEEEFDISESLDFTMNAMGCPVVVMDNFMRNI